MNSLAVEHSELKVRHMLLIQKFAVLHELRLRLAKNVSPQTFDDYHNLVNLNYGNFFRSIRDSLRLAFYIELRAFIGVNVNDSKSKTFTGLDKYDKSTLYQLVHDDRLVKKTDIREDFSGFVSKHHGSILKVQNVRHSIAHSKPWDQVYGNLTPDYEETKLLLNDLADIIEKAGLAIKGVRNNPYYFVDNNPISDEVENIFRKLDFSSRSEDTNNNFMNARAKWLRGSEKK